MKFVKGTSGSPKNQFKKGNKINVGKKHSKERRTKIRNATKGKPRPSMQGKKNKNWKGGITYNKEYQKEYIKKIRKATIVALGNKCFKCGFDDERALQIDHIMGGGNKERKERAFKGNFCKHVLQSFLKHENKYQLLCANCNWIKRFENNEIKGNLT